MVRNIFFFSGGIILFITGVIIYGIVLNLKDVSLTGAIRNNGYAALDDPWILIDRSSFTLNLYQDTVLIKSYRASFGRNVQAAKSRKNDNATPVGEYQICSIDTSHKYYKFLQLNYPNLMDAAEALRKGVISQQQYDKLRFEYYYDECPKLDTPLGSGIGIHGIGRLNYVFKNLPFVFNWTDGSVALSDEHIDEIYSVVKRGTKIVIK
jgi:murein L,D-transpeptidase YafK